MIKNILILIFCSNLLFASLIDDVIKKVEDNLNGKSAKMNIEMIIHTSRTIRTMKLESVSQGTQKSFMKITYPEKDRGITFLKIDHTMWQYVPKIERVIKIPASMMLQSWMGTDFSNDDLVKESSISEDYNSKILSENTNTYKIEQIPKEEAAVVWGKIIMTVSKEFYLPLYVEYYDEDGVLIRVLEYKNIEKFSDRFYPTLWEMTPKDEDKKGNKTIIKVNKAVFDEDIDSGYFTKQALKRYSK
jgi:outer membrane lipoprotein-sorting protein